MHQARFNALLEDDSAFLPGVDADEWAVTRNYQAQTAAPPPRTSLPPAPKASPG
ncbi:MAG: hypothetical protein IPH95_08405 [Candidatus Promineofilum sp.]|nr:hypothetical protein [Promineifilum sp.]